MDDEAMIDRALQAYFRRSAVMMQPSRGNCEVKAHEGRYYVLIRNSSDTLAVYEVHGNPLGEYKLRGIASVPEGLE